MTDEEGDNGSENNRDGDKDKDKVVVHLLMNTAEKVDKVADEDKADRGHVQKNCSVVLALPNVAVLPDGKDYW